MYFNAKIKEILTKIKIQKSSKFFRKCVKISYVKMAKKCIKTHKKIDLTPPTAIPRNFLNILYAPEGVSYQSLSCFKTLV